MTMVMESKGNVQFFGDLLRQRGADVLSDFHFAGEDPHLAIGGNVQPRADVFGKFVPAEGAARLLRPCGRFAEADKQAAPRERAESRDGRAEDWMGEQAAGWERDSRKSESRSFIGLPPASECERRA